MVGVGDRVCRVFVAGLVAVLASIAPMRADAQQERRFEMQLFLPPAGTGATFTIDRTAVPRHLNAVFGVGGSVAIEPFERGPADGSTPVLNYIGQVEVLAALGLFEFLELGVAVPLVFLEAADGAADAATLGMQRGHIGLGDIRLSAKIPIVRGDFSLSARFVAQMPTGVSASRPADDMSNPVLGDYMSMDYWVATPSVLLGVDLGALSLSSEIGYRLRQRRFINGFEQDDELHVSLGLNVPLIDELALIAETQLRVGVAGRLDLQSYDVPWTANVGARIRPVSGFTIDLGVGRGVPLPGDGGAGWGASEFRAFALARFATDNDEACAAGPEDFDGFEDGDFCADPDNDGDGREDSVDECPNDAEDIDRFADDDGCPDTDNDADGVPDETDACPTRSEDRDGFDDDDGCPEPDNDQDGVPDGLDQCPMEPEDRDNFEDDDGCPEPGPEAASVTVTDTRILISERIYFDYDRDTIRQVSAPMLDEVARVVRELPASLRVRVDGYSDNQGVRAYNFDLSYRRARAVVEYLVGRGVPRNRLEYRGYGPDNPVAPNDSPEGRALNRRVEFTILNEGERAGSGRRRTR